MDGENSALAGRQESANTRCARCAAPLRCGALAGAASCWCATLPPLAEPLAEAACLCPDCLQAALAQTRR